MLRRIIAGQIRHFFSVGGGAGYVYLLERGVEPTDIEAIATGLVAVSMALWSVYEKYKSEKKGKLND